MNKHTPLLSALLAYSQANPTRLHMPGHKGTLPYDLPIGCDVTELPPTGDLYRDTDGPIRAAEALWAHDFNAEAALFLTGGASQGIAAALTTLTAPGDTILLDNCAHLAFTHAMALLDLHPIRLPRTNDVHGLPAPLTPHALNNALAANPHCATVCVTSPTYYGGTCDIPSLAAICHAHNARLFVDSAHAAHFPYAGLGSPAMGADVFVISAHKTLYALGQSAVLFTNDAALAHPLRQATQLFGTSSPSYLLLASLDAARAWHDTHRAVWQPLAEQLQALRAECPVCLPSHDPFRLTIDTAALGYTGDEAATLLQNEYNLYAEAHDTRHILHILTAADGESSLTALRQAIQHLQNTPRAPIPPPAPHHFTPIRKLSPRQATLAPTQALPLTHANGRIAARDIGFYPPGIPLIAAGEVIDASALQAAGFPGDTPVIITHHA